ncbi:MAG: sigma-54-dependent transcriptional regulator [Desulfitobacteriaceae bacterium]
MSETVTILVADDELSLRIILQTVLQKAGFRVDTAENGVDALQKVRGKDYEVVLLDIRMPQMDGLQCFYEIHQEQPDLPVILMTAFSSAEMAVEAMKRGAFDYIPKPFNVEEVRILVERALRMRKLTREVDMLSREVKALSEEVEGSAKLIGESPKMQEIYKDVGRIANSTVTVLLTGDSGTGKGVVAKTIHYSSERWQKPFLQINCGAIPEGLLESELFGHEKGAFTGAWNQKPGKFELAEGGTLFLDEVAEMGPSLQVKLLRVLQEHEFERVGGTKTLSADVRVIAATNRDLTREIAEKRFRLDLYYRLNVVTLHLPPLRERGDDIVLLADYFLHRFAAGTDKEGIFFSPEVSEIFRHYPWPGNVRELENAVERALIMSNTKVILPEHLPLNLTGEGAGSGHGTPQLPFRSMREVLAETERKHIADALAITGGNKAHAANLLQISRRALIYKIQDYHL